MIKRAKKYWFGCLKCGYSSVFQSRFTPELRSFQKQLASAHASVSPNCNVDKAKIQVTEVRGK